MPYSGADDKNLPSNVKKMGKKQRRQWVEIFNSSMEKDGDESKAFRMANGVLKKQTKAWVETWDVYDRQVYQDTAGYNPLGADASRGCANCNWFVSPDACVLVSGVISPTGSSKFWTEKQSWKPTPLEVIIVEDTEDDTEEVAMPMMKEESSIIQRVKELLGLTPAKDSSGNSEGIPAETTINNVSGSANPPVQAPIYFIKQKDGRTRFFTMFSNNFKDRQGEIIREEAHKEFCDWAEKNKSFPELQLWHCGHKSKWGQTDWLDYTNGFMCASGLVDEGREDIVERLSKEEIAVSHGFYGLSLKGDNGVYRYRSFEISPLPKWAAANTWTNFAGNIEDLTMPFSDKRKSWLKEISGLTDDDVSKWEADVDSLSSKLKEIGVDFKSTEDADLATQMKEMTSAFNSMITIFQKMREDDKKALDDKIAEVLTAEISKLPQGFKASESSNNIPSDEQKKELKKDTDWFGDIVMKSMANI